MLVGHVLIQQCMTGRQELKVVRPMLFRRGRIHLQDDQKHRLRQIELKALKKLRGPLVNQKLKSFANN